MMNIVERLLEPCRDYSGEMIVRESTPRYEFHCDVLYDAAAHIATLEAAILTIIKSMNEYLPPTGGDKDKFISEVIGAVDNPAIVAALRTELDHAP